MKQAREGSGAGEQHVKQLDFTLHVLLSSTHIQYQFSINYLKRWSQRQRRAE
jgi:hypothetical protein